MNTKKKFFGPVLILFLVVFLMFCCTSIDNWIQGAQVMLYPTELQNKGFDDVNYGSNGN
ncbi:hypothetical protein [endosymbiont 'TC1' of Trimyema compressum]|uniref:hypothetical protein n=1 Tax=endosymbiont 'TC1' of Trimyema compressum TaxID=243899 RepID=UPI001392290D|nr:hypothetical protein [endosymbiont 'TC1' of Trimyema compressum]